jgi:hypothetical protein
MASGEIEKEEPIREAAPELGTTGGEAREEERGAEGGEAREEERGAEGGEARREGKGEEEVH